MTTHNGANHSGTRASARGIMLILAAAMLDGCATVPGDYVEPPITSNQYAVLRSPPKDTHLYIHKIDGVYVGGYRPEWRVVPGSRTVVFRMVTAVNSGNTIVLYRGFGSTTFTAVVGRTYATTITSISNVTHHTIVEDGEVANVGLRP